jgi:hypothetical protein
VCLNTHGMEPPTETEFITVHTGCVMRRPRAVDEVRVYRVFGAVWCLVIQYTNVDGDACKWGFPDIPSDECERALQQLVRLYRLHQVGREHYCALHDVRSIEYTLIPCFGQPVGIELSGYRRGVLCVITGHGLSEEEAHDAYDMIVAHLPGKVARLAELKLC